MSCEQKLNVTGLPADLASFKATFFTADPTPSTNLIMPTALDLHYVIPEPAFTPVNVDSALGICGAMCGWPTLTALINDPQRLPELESTASAARSALRTRLLLRAQQHLQQGDQLGAMQGNLARHGYLSSSQWRVENWGTVSNTYDRAGGSITPLTYFPGKATLVCTFKTEDKPPVPVIYKLAKAWPQLVFRLRYHNPMVVAGVIIGRDGVLADRPRDCIAALKHDFGWTDEDIYGPFLENADVANSSR